MRASLVRRPRSQSSHNVFGAFSISISTGSGGDRDTDVSSPSRPDEGRGRGRGKGEASHPVHDPNGKLNEDKMGITPGLNYFTAEAVETHLRGRSSTLIPKKTFMTRMSRRFNGVEYHDVMAQS
jgi:hypothetical protein